MNTQKLFYHLSHYPPRIAYGLGFGPLVGRLILLLTTTGRKSGLARVTPLQYEEIGNVFYVAAAHGLNADWVCNLQFNPCVSVRVGPRQFNGEAKIILDSEQIARYLDYRLQRHPRMMGFILRLDGLSATPDMLQLHEYAKKLVVVSIMPESNI
jgi:deazaflavin-dependent oxidoreductase (nitroreductase family)